MDLCPLRNHTAIAPSLYHEIPEFEKTIVPTLQNKTVPAPGQAATTILQQLHSLQIHHNIFTGIAEQSPANLAADILTLLRPWWCGKYPDAAFCDCQTGKIFLYITFGIWPEICIQKHISSCLSLKTKETTHGCDR